MADASVRPARAADVAEIARIQVDTWRVGYARLLPAEVLASVAAEQAEGRWAAAVAAPPSPRHHVLLACEGQAVVGFVAFGPVDPDDSDDAAGAFAGEDEPPAPGAVGMVLILLVEPRWGRRGHGSRLLTAAVDLMRADGSTHALAWVPEADAASISLYGSAGWEPDGYVRALDADGHQFREIRLHTRLD
ncbi:MAG TPA: GNAT family N-acetyltransferase [Mycobacteriales bacterium]|nr:GNAT family N-acetyltransferase [Mycobacteriales bacterium]